MNKHSITINKNQSHEPRLRERGPIKLIYTLKHRLLNINIKSDGCFWIDMSATKMYNLVKFKKILL